MWTVIYVTHDGYDAQHIKDKLTSEGFLVKLRENNRLIEILVPELEANEAHVIIDQY
ncbi:glutamate decarboxylase [Caminicella sporogenes]|uniref:glutamate decarboxylase n=1 Tax=Caminicella sporogenes TaxID=166485 RepID=UPI0025417AAA|nr:glutamate decarboxylase [Caminicella sporogenes]WIF95234.1 glutamate decarboxylase [Caminicella sporogenes]